MARDLEQAIDRVRARVSRAVFAATALTWLSILAGACACAALLVRAAFGWESGRAALLFVPLVLAPLLAARAVRRKRVSAAGAATWLDVQAGADGALVTGFEARDAAWSTRVESALSRAISLPRARVGRPAAFCAGAFAFALLALFVPIPRAVPGPERALATAAIQRAEEKLATLEEEVELEPELAAELHERLERLKQEGDGHASSESLFEAADRAAEELAQEAATQTEPAASVQEALADAAAAAGTDPEAAQKELESALSELAKTGLSKGLEDVMAAELGLESLELPPGTQLDAAQIARTSTALRARLGDKLSKLAAAGLLKEGRGREGEPADIDDVAEHLCSAECGTQPGGT